MNDKAQERETHTNVEEMNELIVRSIKEPVGITLSPFQIFVLLKTLLMTPGTNNPKPIFLCHPTG